MARAEVVRHFLIAWAGISQARVEDSVQDGIGFYGVTALSWLIAKDGDGAIMPR